MNSLSVYILQQWRQRGGCHTQAGGGSDQIWRRLPDPNGDIRHTAGGGSTGAAGGSNWLFLY